MPAPSPDPDGPERPLRVDAERNRQLILDAAQRAFAEQGLGVRLDEIADLAGVGVGTVYRRFKDKDALVAALFEQQIAGIVTLADEALATCSDGTGLRWFLERAADAMAEDRGLQQLLTSPQATAEAMAMSVREKLEPRIAELLGRAVRAGTARPDLARHDMGVVMLVLSAVVDATSQARTGLRERYTALVLDGLTAGAGEQELPGPEPVADDVIAVVQSIVPRPRRPGARG